MVYHNIVVVPLHRRKSCLVFKIYFNLEFCLCLLCVLLICILKMFVFTSGYMILFLVFDFVTVAIVLQNIVLRLKQTGTHPL